MEGPSIRNPLGIMQGRLLPKYNGLYQAHPVGYWQDEFPLAKEMGLNCIEFILDYNDFQKNPLMTMNGRQEIQFVSKQTGVSIHSICADYFMEAPLHSDDNHTAKKSSETLLELLKASADLSIKDIVIPCVDKSSIQNEHMRDRFKEILLSIIPGAEQYEVNISLETDLNPSQFEKLLTVLDSPRVTVNYDIGNSAALGYNYTDELNAYGIRISDIHIKDRKYGGGSVKLGTGNADINGFFNALENYDYRGPFIMQAYRDDEGITIFKNQLNWLKQQVPSLC
jgi:L-ribulose-5-phosphate 3-epimerase UlaE|tara:strand:+ start:1512 stop:2357 length:846 start_codon:yes stop_codon:yes gene_type:complete